MKPDPFLSEVGVYNVADALRNSVNASVQRNKVYVKKTSAKNRQDFRDAWGRALQFLTKGYYKKISDNTHLRFIQAVADAMTKNWGHILVGGKLRFGTSQKALNLYLKFLWRLGKIPEPPHCPVDGVILKSIRVHDAWTQSDNPDQYKDWISKIRAKAAPKSAAMWEYEIWNGVAKKNHNVKTPKPNQKMTRSSRSVGNGGGNGNDNTNLRNGGNHQDCPKCQLGKMIVRVHRENPQNIQLPPLLNANIDHDHGHRIRVSAENGWAWQFHINLNSVRINRFSEAPDARIRYNQFCESRNAQNGNFGNNIYGNGLGSIYCLTVMGANAQEQQFHLIANEAIYKMSQLYTL